MNPELPPWQTAAWSTLAARAERGSLPHALLLAGAGGLGKRAFAENFVRARLCEHPRSGHACGTCRACALLAAGTHPDRILVTPETNERTGKPRTEIIVEQIRALSARLAMSAQLGGWQIAVIDPADAMNPAAANALLKTLEEPSASSLIVLVADQPWRLPATIRSRCQRIDFAAPSWNEALAWLRTQGVREPEPALQAAGGNPGRALVYAQGDEPARRESVRKDLVALARGRASTWHVAHAWTADEPIARLEHAARLLHQAARDRAQGSASAFDPSWDDLVLQAAFERVNRLRELLRGPLRAEPALIECLAAFPRTT
ncbi:MAG TPA: DNA polymerase III subunit delta' [Rhodanobacteraceae bacterium]|nr:DNA polymerase III subunit delta' [Rhodanobacteraceae bacterium]